MQIFLRELNITLPSSNNPRKEQKDCLSLGSPFAFLVAKLRQKITNDYIFHYCLTIIKIVIKFLCGNIIFLR